MINTINLNDIDDLWTCDSINERLSLMKRQSGYFYNNTTELEETKKIRTTKERFGL